MQYWLEEKLTQASNMKEPELVQPVEKKGKCFSFIARTIGGTKAG